MASAGSLMMRSTLIDLFSSRLAYLDEILGMNLNAPELTYTRIFNVRDSKRAHEETTGIVGFGQFTVKPEGSSIDYDAMLQGYDKRYTHSTFAKGFQVSFEAAQDDIDGAFADAAPALARVAQNSIETDAFNDLALGFTTVTTPDGVALFSGSHPLVAGGTASNLVSADFDQGSLETAINLYDDMRDDRNQLIEGGAAMIIFPPEMRWAVSEVLQSQLRSDTANNAINVVNQLGLEQVMVKYLSDDDNWFLASRPEQHRLLYYWRLDPMSDHTIDFDTGNFKSKMTYRNSHGPADWRNLVGGLGQ